MAAKKEKENFTAEFFEFLDGEIQTALTNEDKERSDNLSYLSQILDNLKVRQSMTVTALKTPEKDKRESNSQKADEIPPGSIGRRTGFNAKKSSLWKDENCRKNLEAKNYRISFLLQLRTVKKMRRKKDLKAPLPPARLQKKMRRKKT